MQTQATVRTCADCGESQTVPPTPEDDFPLRCPCGERWCGNCRERTATRRWQPASMGRHYMSVCAECWARLDAAELGR